MPYAEIQRNTGSFNATSGSATFATGTTAGNTVILVVAGVTGPGLNPPTGFTNDSGQTMDTTSNVNVGVLRKSSVGAGETSYTITMAAVTSKVVVWTLLEIEGFDATSPVEAFGVGGHAGAGGLTTMTGAVLTPTAYDGLAITALATRRADTTVAVVTPSTGGFTEIQDVNATDGSTVSVDLAVCTKAIQQVVLTESCSGAISPAADDTFSVSIIYLCAGAKFAADIRAMNGFEFGQASGLTSGQAGDATVAPLAATTGTFAVEAAATRTGNFGLRVFATSAISNVKLGNLAPNAPGAPVVGKHAFVVRLCLRFRSALPGVDVKLFAVGNAQIWYRTATQKLGAVIVGGTERASDATVTSGQWIGVDLRYDSLTTAFTLDWQVDYNANPGDTVAPVTQTQATFTAGAAVTTADVILGWTASTTATVDYDDYAAGHLRTDYPLGNLRVWPLNIDTAATATASGTIGNFALVTANNTGTVLSSGNIATARNNIATVPPVVGASAVGVCQVTTDSQSLLIFPMTTRSAAANSETIRAVKLYVCGWTAGAASNTITLQANTNTAAYGLPTSATAVAFSTSAGVWTSAVVRGFARMRWLQQTSAGGNDLGSLDDLEFRCGESTDATPDVGVLSVVGEVAMAEGSTKTLAGTISSVATDDTSAGILTLTTNAPASDLGDTAVHYEIGGVATDYTVPQGTADTHVIDAEDDPTTNVVAVYPPVEPTTTEPGPV